MSLLWEVVAQQEALLQGLALSRGEYLYVCLIFFGLLFLLCFVFHSIILRCLGFMGEIKIEINFNH